MFSFSFGICGIFISYDNQYTSEFFFGMSAPLFMGIIIVLAEKWFHNNHPNLLGQFFSISFIVKMILYGLFIIILFNFYSFSHIHFITSFAVCFIVLHISEAVYFKNTYK